MPEGFTPLERAVLDWIAEEVKEPVLGVQIRSASLKSRELTGHGAFSELALPSPPPVSCGRTDPIRGPEILCKKTGRIGGSILILEEGRISTLEIFGYDEGMDPLPTTFELRRTQA